MAKKKTAAQKAPAKKTVRKKTITKRKKSTKKKAPNKSEQIRAYMKTHKSASAKDVQAALAKKGLSVTEALIYNVRGRAGKKKTSKKKVKVRVTKAGEPSPIEDMKEAGDLMFKAVELVVRAGTKEAQQLVTAASKIVDTARTQD